MKKGALFRRLSKAGKKARSVSISVRIPREDAEELDKIENATAIRYSWVIQMLVKRFLQAYERKKSIKAPIEVVVLNYGEVFTPLPISIASSTSVRMIWKSNAKGENTFVNGNLLSFVGKTYDEMMGFGWHEVVHPEHLERALASWKKAMRTKTTHAYPFLMKLANGDYTWVFSVGIPELDPSGKLMGYNGSVYEVEPYLEKWIEMLETDPAED